MLVDQTVVLKPGSIAMMLLSTGQWIIGRVDDVADDYVKMRQVRMVAVSPSPGGQIDVGLVPFSLVGDDDAAVVIYRSHIAATTKVGSQIETAYRAQTSGIVPANQLVMPKDERTPPN